MKKQSGNLTQNQQKETLWYRMIFLDLPLLNGVKIFFLVAYNEKEIVAKIVAFLQK